jgi:molybdopterin-guanine dinucleotide biosynthesis protein A
VEVERDPTAVLILAGGEGRRLGGPKAWLRWRDGPLLLEVVRRLSSLEGLVVVCARRGQELPPGNYDRVDDDVAGAGPLAGLSAGLTAFATDSPGARVAVAACDYPLTDPALFRALARHDTKADLVLPRWEGHLHPLQAVWRADLGGACSEALRRGERRLSAVFTAVDARIVDAENLRGFDVARALLNVNDSEALARARLLAG